MSLSPKPLSHAAFWARLGLLLALAAGLVGFSSAANFELDALLGGGGGAAFTGSPTSRGRSCAVCHQSDTAARFVVSSPSPLFEAGYEPGQDYLIQIEITEELKGLGVNAGCSSGGGGCNRNLFVAEILGPTGQPLGMICSADLRPEDASCPSDSSDGTTLINGGTAIAGQSLALPSICRPGEPPVPGCVDLQAERQRGATEDQINALLLSKIHGQTVWEFRWRAPVGDTAPAARLYVGVVDGDGGSSFDPAYADYQGDAIATGVFGIKNTLTLPTSAELPVGCGAAPGPASPWPALLPALLLLCLLWTRRSGSLS